MKIQSPLLVTVAAIGLCLLICWRFCSKKCDLPAPKSLTIEATSPTSFEAKWTSVAKSGGYRLVVADSGIIDTTFTDNLKDTSVVISNLMPGRSYAVAVSCRCNETSLSPHFNLRDILGGVPMAHILIEDEVVMLPPGSPQEEETGCAACNGDWTTVTNQINLDESGLAAGAVSVLEVQFSDGNLSKTFKMYFKKDCKTVYLRDCTKQTGFISAGSGNEGFGEDIDQVNGSDLKPNKVSLSSPGADPFLDMISKTNSGTRTVDFTKSSPCTGCTIRYRTCPTPTNPPAFTCN